MSIPEGGLKESAIAEFRSHGREYRGKPRRSQENTLRKLVNKWIFQYNNLNISLRIRPVTTPFTLRLFSTIGLLCLLLNRRGPTMGIGKAVSHKGLHGLNTPQHSDLEGLVRRVNRGDQDAWRRILLEVFSV